MILLSPLKKATSRKGWYHELKDLADLKTCITQGFGENLVDYTQFGIKGHNGIDFALEDGTEVFASHDGIVESVSTDKSAGIGVVLKDLEKKTIYWHFKEATVHKGDYIKAGDMLGYGDNTGWSTGPHLHLGLKFYTPNGEVRDRENGYDGAVDPLPYIVWPNMKITKESLPLYYKAMLHRVPDTDFWVGHDVEEFLQAMMTQEEWKKLDLLITDARNI